MRIRQSFCYPMFASDQFSPAEIFRAAADIGFEAVEFWHRDQYGDHRELFDDARESGLGISSMIGQRSLTDGMNQAQNHERIFDETAASLEVAREYGVSGVICFSGNRTSTQTDIEGMRACVTVLKRLVPLAEDAGVNLNVELLNSKVDHPDYQCDRSDWAFALCEFVDSPRVRILYDIYHMQIMEGDIIRTITSNVESIGHIHTAGNPGRGPLSGVQELDYRAVCTAIARTGYGGLVGHEFKPAGDPVEALEGAFRICDVDGVEK